MKNCTQGQKVKVTLSRNYVFMLSDLIKLHIKHNVFNESANSRFINDLMAIDKVLDKILVKPPTCKQTWIYLDEMDLPKEELRKIVGDSLSDEKFEKFWIKLQKRKNKKS